MNLSQFILVYDQIKSRIFMPVYLEEICAQIIHGNASIVGVHKILDSFSINASIAKVDFLHFIIEYIHILLEKELLTEEEKGNIIYLKRMFQIEAGDFHYHCKAEVEKIISCQLSKIYYDKNVTAPEALFKVDLQEFFDLSFDEMNEFVKLETSQLIIKGMDPKDLDVFYPNHEFFKLKKQGGN